MLRPYEERGNYFFLEGLSDLEEPESFDLDSDDLESEAFVSEGFSDLAGESEPPSFDDELPSEEDEPLPA